MSLHDTMNYQTFKERVIARLEKDVSGPKSISIQQIYRNNGELLDGLVILENGVNISPTLYLNHYFADYQNGCSFHATYERIWSNYRNNRSAESLDVRFFTDFSRARSRIMMKLINYEKNQQLLTMIPHLRYLDLAIVFYCYLPVDDALGNATILLHHSHAQLWGQTPDSLLAIARENGPTLLPPRMVHISQMLSDIMTKTPYPTMVLPEDPLFPMYVLTNSQSIFGAGCLLYDGLLRSYADRFRSDFYILPSSVHELILVPPFPDSCLADLHQMVREVNATQVKAEEFLSDHAYYYSRKEDKITWTE